MQCGWVQKKRKGTERIPLETWRRHKGGQHGEGDRGWSDVSTRPGTPGLLVTRKDWKRDEGLSPRAFREHSPASTLISDRQPPEPSDNILVVLSHFGAFALVKRIRLLPVSWREDDVQASEIPDVVVLPFRISGQTHGGEGRRGHVFV